MQNMTYFKTANFAKDDIYSVSFEKCIDAYIHPLFEGHNSCSVH